MSYQARYRQAAAVKKGTQLVESALQVLQRAETWSYEDGDSCFHCGGAGSIAWAPAHYTDCKICHGTGKYPRSQTPS